MCQDCGCEIATDLMTKKMLAPKLATRKVLVEQSVVQKNMQLAEQNRQWFRQNNIKVLNIMSSPGSGKTYLLEKTVAALGKLKPMSVAILTGDQEQSFDADRLKAAGAYVNQINTVSSCHLDASHIARELNDFVAKDTELLIIENVGNLVCPAAFDLGEELKIAVLSTTEGEDKPAKYPLLFHAADLIIVTKMDLEPHLDWNKELCEQYIRRVNSEAPILFLSAKTGQGLGAWIDFLVRKLEK